MTKHYIEVRTKRKDWRVTSSYGYPTTDAAQTEIARLQGTQLGVSYRVLTLADPTPQQRAR